MKKALLIPLNILVLALAMSWVAWPLYSDKPWPWQLSVSMAALAVAVLLVSVLWKERPHA